MAIKLKNSKDDDPSKKRPSRKTKKKVGNKVKTYLDKQKTLGKQSKEYFDKQPNRERDQHEKLEKIHEEKFPAYYASDKKAKSKRKTK